MSTNTEPQWYLDLLVKETTDVSGTKVQTWTTTTAGDIFIPNDPATPAWAISTTEDSAGALTRENLEQAFEVIQRNRDMEVIQQQQEAYRRLLQAYEVISSNIEKPKSDTIIDRTLDLRKVIWNRLNKKKKG